MKKQIQESIKIEKGLTDGYISKLLKQQKIPITPETIEMKRMQIKLKRFIKQIENETK